MPLFLVSFRDPETGEPLHACPRSLLAETVKSVGEGGKGEGWMCMAGAEFEVSRGEEWSGVTEAR